MAASGEKLDRKNNQLRKETEGLLEVVGANDAKKVRMMEKEPQRAGFTVGEPPRPEWKMVPPDGGWGWLVLMGAMMVNILVPGIVKSFGVLFVEFLEVFDAGPAAASWIPALCYFLYSSLGPLSSILSVRYSYRTVTVIGGSFAAAGMMISCWASSVTYLYFSYGVLVGTGAGLSFPPTVYIVTSYFVRLRGLANGLCMSGSALGSIIMPPIMRYLLETYGYRGSVLILGGLTLNVWVAAIFFQPVEEHMKRVPIDYEDQEEGYADYDPSAYYTTGDGDSRVNGAICYNEEDENEELEEQRMNNVVDIVVKNSFGDNVTVKNDLGEQTGLKKNTNVDNLAIKVSSFDEDDLTGQSGDSNMDQATPLRTFSNADSAMALKLHNADFKSNPNVNNTSSSNFKSLIDSPVNVKSGINSAESTPSFGFARSASAVVMQAAAERRRKASAPSQSLLNARRPMVQGVPKTPKRSPSTSSFQYMSTPFHGSTLSAFNRPDEFASQLTLQSLKETFQPVTTCCGLRKTKPKEDPEKPRERNKFFDVTLLKNPIYLIILISNCTNAITYTNFIILLPSYAIYLGFDKSLSAYLLSIVSAFDLVGRIGGSALSDTGFLPKPMYFVGGLFFSGFSLAILPLANSYGMIGACCGCFGLASGVYVGVTAIIMAEMLGEDRLTSTYGISLFVNGVLQLIGPPVCGLWVERTRAYKVLLTCLGIISVVGASIWTMMPHFLRRRARREAAAKI